MANFETAFGNLSKLTYDQIHFIVVGSASELVKDIIYSTPFDTGRARNNWILTIDKISDEKIDEVDKSGNKAIARAKQELTKPLGKYIYIQNNLDYILKLEYGWSKQAPQGFVRQNILRMNTLIKKAIK